MNGVKVEIDLADLKKIMGICERIRNPNVPYMTNQLSMANFALDLAGKEAAMIQEIIYTYGIKHL
jgi:hypothetical protein